MKTSAEKLWLGGTAFAGLVIVVIGWFFLIAPERHRADDVETRIADAELQSVSLQSRISDLTAQQKRWASFAAELATARQALPSSNDMAAFLRTVQTIGRASGATVSSLTVGDPEALNPTAATAATGSTPAASTAPAAPAPGAPAAGAAGGSGILAIPLTASVIGSDAALTDFLTKLQSVQPRAVLISEITRGSVDGSGGRTMQLTMQAFTAPAAASTTGATPAQPGR